MELELTIHLGLHKTASTFMQKRFFPLHSEDLGYLDLRIALPRFLFYILHCNDLDWTPASALSLLKSELPQANRLNSNRMLISDEQFCGSPWDNASNRKRSFDRLHQLFPEAKYLIVFRNQCELVQSLYLQYIKTGGSASWQQFLAHGRHPLTFSLRSYLNYGDYLEYVISHVGKERVGCFLYEDMKYDPLAFCKDLANFLCIEPKEELTRVVHRKANKSISPSWAKALTYANKFIKSERQPFLLLPRGVHRQLLFLATRLSFSKKKNVIPENVVDEFCKDAKSHNSILKDFVGRDISKMGY